MKTVNPMRARRVVKTMKPRNPVLAALKDRRGGAGAHRKSRGALRRAEKMAVAQEVCKVDIGGANDPDRGTTEVLPLLLRVALHSGT